MHPSADWVLYAQATIRKIPATKNRLLVTTLAALMFTVQAEAQRQRAEALEITRATGLSRPIAVPAEGMADELQTRPDMLLDDLSMAVLVGTGLFDQATSRSRLGETGLFAALAFFGAPLNTTRAQRCWLDAARRRADTARRGSSA